MQCEVWSVECEDFASSLAEKKNACRGKDTVGTGFSSNYRSFIFGKLPPPACRVYVIMCLQACHASNCSPGQRRSLQGYPIGHPAKRQLEAPVPKLRHCQVLPTAIDGKKRQVQLVPFPFYIHRSFQPSLVFVLALGNLRQPERAPDLHNMPYSQVIRRTQLQISRR